ncbi:MAG: hypothetical protein V3575_01525 [Candidatus Absconditabacteria bacterium]
MIPLDGEANNVPIFDDYTNGIINELESWSNIFPQEEIKTIHFGGGSPQTLGLDNIMKILDFIKDKFNLEYLEEVGIELNPYPYEEVIDMISCLNKKYKDFFRLRYSIGIQSFDDEILTKSGRNYNFNTLLMFLRKLPSIKETNNVFNFDFIAFGRFKEDKKGNKVLWDEKKQKIFVDFVSSGFTDSISLYTLELFPGSPWYGNKNLQSNLFGSEDEIYEEFSYLKSILLNSNLKRYEISNFSNTGKQSLHNKIYWNMENYIGIGVSSSSFLTNKDKKLENNTNLKSIGLEVEKGSYGVRFKNTSSMKNYLKGEFIDKKSVQNLTQQDYLIEKFMLSLRTQEGVGDLQEFVDVLVPSYKELIDEYENNGLLVTTLNGFALTDNGMDLFNQVVTELLTTI